MEHKKFIKIGDDRVDIFSIDKYGVRQAARYFVRNEAHTEVNCDTYQNAFILYMADEEPDANASPMLDINGYPVRMDRKVVQEGHLPPIAFDIQTSRVLYVHGSWTGRTVLTYVEGECGFDIDAKLAELDSLLLDLTKNS